MKPKPINIKPVQQDTLQSKKMSVETPIGKIESDSGSQIVDIISVVGVIAILYIGKKLVDKWLK